MTSYARPICTACKRFDPDSFTCEAFPQGIPEEIFPEGFDHRQPFEGDNGIRFELAEGATLPPAYRL